MALLKEKLNRMIKEFPSDDLNAVRAKDWRSRNEDAIKIVTNIFFSFETGLRYNYSLSSSGLGEDPLSKKSESFIRILTRELNEEDCGIKSIITNRKSEEYLIGSNPNADERISIYEDEDKKMQDVHIHSSGLTSMAERNSKKNSQNIPPQQKCCCTIY